MIRPSATIIEAAACTILAAVAPLSGAPQRFVATAASPVLVPLLPSAKRPAPDDPGRSVDIAVRRFQPSPAGPVQIVVDAVTGVRSTEIGRFA